MQRCLIRLNVIYDKKCLNIHKDYRKSPQQILFLLGGYSSRLLSALSLPRGSVGYELALGAGNPRASAFLLLR